MREIAARDGAEFVVDEIVEHRVLSTSVGAKKKKTAYEFKVRWLGYDPVDDTWISYMEARELEALDVYLQKHPSLKAVLGMP